MLDCDDRSIIVEATCSPLNGPRMLACTAQSLTVSSHPGGEVKSVRRFMPQPGADGDPPLVEEKVGTLSCLRTEANERYIVASMYNGGNCEQCEWHEAYDWTGRLVASDRDRNKTNAVLGELLTDSSRHGSSVIAKKELVGFYSATP